MKIFSEILALDEKIFPRDEISASHCVNRNLKAKIEKFSALKIVSSFYFSATKFFSILNFWRRLLISSSKVPENTGCSEI